MKKFQHEKIKVLRPCLNACDNLLRAGAILEYRRMDESDKDHQDGAPDIEIRYLNKGFLYLLMVECKRPDGKGVHRPKQKEYRDKYKDAVNVTYVIVESCGQMERIVEQHTNFYAKRLREIEL